LLYPGQLIIDATGLGDVLVEQLKEFNPTPVIFTPATKAELLTNVELMHARRQIVYQRWELPDGPGKVWSLEDELRQARWDDNQQRVRRLNGFSPCFVAPAQKKRLVARAEGGAGVRVLIYQKLLSKLRTGRAFDLQDYC